MWGKSEKKASSSVASLKHDDLSRTSKVPENDSAGKYFDKKMDAQRYRKMHTPAKLRSPASSSWDRSGIARDGVPFYRMIDDNDDVEDPGTSKCAACLGRCDDCSSAYWKRFKRAARAFVVRLGFRRTRRKGRRRRRSSSSNFRSLDDGAPASHFAHNCTLAALGIILIILVALERVLAKVLSDRARVGNSFSDFDYRYIVGQVIVLFNIAFPILWLAFRGITTSRRAARSVSSPPASKGNLSPPLAITCDMIANVPKFHTLILALLCCVQHLTTFIALGAVPAPATVIIVQIALPFSVLVSRACGGHRFTATHVVGATIVLAGVGLSIAPILLHDGAELGRSSWCISSKEEFPTCWSSALMLAGAGIISAISTSFQEWMFSQRARPLPPPVLALWLLPMQFAWGVLISPVARHAQRPLSPWGNITVEMAGFGRYLSDGLTCIFEGNTTGIYVVTPGKSFPELCDPILFILIAYVVLGWVLTSVSSSLLRRGAYYLVQISVAVAMVVAWIALAVYEASDRSWEWPLHPSLRSRVSILESVSAFLAFAGTLVYYLARKAPPPPQAETPAVTSLE